MVSLVTRKFTHFQCKICHPCYCKFTIFLFLYTVLKNNKTYFILASRHFHINDNDKYFSGQDFPFDAANNIQLTLYQIV